MMNVMIESAQGICMVVRANVNGDSPERTSLQGLTDTMKNKDTTKKNSIRQITRELIRATASLECADSTAAMVVISAPVIEKNAVGTAPSTAIQPCGANPP